MNLFKVAGTLDWSGWVRGFIGALVSGGAGAVSSGFGGIILDPQQFNVTQGGFGHLMELMGITFAFSAVISLAKFLQVHPVPDQLQTSLATAAAATATASSAIADAKASVEEKH